MSGNGGSDGGPDGGPASSSSGSASSQGAVSGYFRSLGKHDAKTARQFLFPEYRANFGSETAFAAWVANYRSLSGVTLQAARPPDTGTTQQYARYRDLAQWPVTYSATLKTVRERDGRRDGQVRARGSRGEDVALADPRHHDRALSRAGPFRGPGSFRQSWTGPSIPRTK